MEVLDIPYAIKLIRKNEQQTEEWSGGTTTELAIYPEEANFHKRNFDWRLSTATVDTEQSSFTPFPGVWRFTMVLRGELSLLIEGQSALLLKSLEQASYSGDLETTSIGKAKNFNLMVTKGCDAKLHAFHLQKKVQNDYAIAPEKSEFRSFTEAFYCIDGKTAVTIGEKEKIELETGDLLQLSTMEPGERLDITFFPEEVQLVKAVVYT